MPRWHTSKEGDRSSLHPSSYSSSMDLREQQVPLQYWWDDPPARRLPRLLVVPLDPRLSSHHCSRRHTQVVHLSANEVRDWKSGTPANEVRDPYPCHHCSCRHTQVVHLSANEVRDCQIGTPAKKVRDWYSCHHCSRRHIQGVHLSANEVRDCLSGTPANQGDDSSPPPLSPLIFFEGDRCLCLTRKFAVKA